MSTLNLRRRPGQKIVIGEPPNDILLTVKSVTDGDEVTLTFNGDKCVPIDRLEVKKRKEKNKQG